MTSQKILLLCFIPPPHSFLLDVLLHHCDSCLAMYAAKQCIITSTLQFKSTRKPYLDFSFHFSFYVYSQVSLLLMENYEPPVLACAVTEVLSQLTGEEPSLTPTLIVPFVLALSMLKCERKSSITKESRPSVYRIQVGPERDITQVLAIRTEKAPPSLQIHHEPATCLLQLVRVLKLPTCVLIGQRGRLLSDKAIGEELKVSMSALFWMMWS